MNGPGRALCGLAAVFGAAAMITSLGCISTVRLPASEIVKLPVPEGQEKQKTWAVVQTAEGETQTLCGPIETVGVEQRVGVSRIFPPFTARIEGETIFVRDALGARAFRAADVIALNVDYENRKVPRAILGASLVTVGTPIFGVGAFAFIAGLASDSAFSESVVAVGILGMMLGGGALGPGISLLATDPSPPGEVALSLRPVLRVGLDGASISTSF